MTGFVAAVVEAWQELRIHKLRVLLSLIGVAVAVCSLTTAVAVGSMAQQAVVETAERQEGRAATYGIYPYSMSGEATDLAKTRRLFDETMDEFKIKFHSVVGEMPMAAELGGKRRDVYLRVVEPAYGDMRRIVPVQGRWLSPGDAQNLSPAIVVNAKFLKARGLGPGSLPATVTLEADGEVTATIVGQAPKGTGYSDGPEAFMLIDSYERWFSNSQAVDGANFQMWIPPKGAKPLAKAVAASMKKKLPGYEIDMGRQDYASGGGDPYKEFRLVLAGVSGIILLLGALSLLNIALVTIKQRVREIGIRRSFGATTGRVFFSVMMESVVATVVAGAVGVVAAVGIAKSSFVNDEIIGSVTDAPGFPVSAAVLGLLVSLAVGAVAGILPALIAVRVKIIDAIRF